MHEIWNAFPQECYNPQQCLKGNQVTNKGRFMSTSTHDEVVFPAGKEGHPFDLSKKHEVSHLAIPTKNQNTTHSLFLH